MSLQKSSSRLRFQSNTQSHTKNKLINSLINQKLSEQKQQVLNRYVKLAKKAQQQKQPHQQQTQFQIRKRSSSLKNINVSMEKIRESLTFNPLKPLNEQAQFVISKQHSSPLLNEQQVAQVSNLRLKSNLFEVKLSSKDRQGLEYVTLQTPEKDRKGNQWVKKVQENLDNQLWLPGLPHTQMLLENLQDNGSIAKMAVPDFVTLSVVKSPTFSEFGNTFTPITGSLTSRNQLTLSQKQLPSQTSILPTTKLLPILTVQREQLLYDFKKFHKDDYLALQKWFQKNILQAHKKYPLSVSSSQNNQKPLFNLLYSIHIASMQELIRLTYVEMWQKALVMEKVFWSLVRLFGGLIEEQHKINYNEYKIFQKEVKEQRLMYEERCSKLETMMLRAQAQTKSTQTLRQRLSLAYVTYSRVNRHLSSQLQYTTRQLTELQQAFNFMTMKFMKVIDFLEQEENIKKIVDEQETVYYLRVRQNDKLEEIMRIKTGKQERKRVMKKRAEQEVKQKMVKQGKAITDQKYKDEFEKALIAKRMEIQNKFSQQQSQQVFQTRVGQHILQVQHQLNKYWHSKQQSLKVKEITHEQLLNYTTQDVGTSTYEKFSTQQLGCQFPQEKQKSFAEFLREQIEKEKQQHQKELHKQQDLYVSLKELYEESYAKVKTLEFKKNQLTSELESTQRLLQKRESKIRELETQLSVKNNDLLIKSQFIESMLRQKNQLEKTISSNNQKTLEIEKKLTHQLQNSQSLVKSNLKMKEQIEKLTIKLKELQSCLNQNQTKKGQIQIQLHKTEQDLSEFRIKYEKLHKNLLKIAPSVDSFLDFKRYDRESIVIASVKKDLEKYFPEYFCKDSDVFLTK